MKDYNSKKRSRHETEKKTKIITKPTQQIAENSNETLTIEPQSKRRKTTGTKRRTIEDETAILYALKVYKNNLPDDAVTSVRKRLSEVWTVKKI